MIESSSTSKVPTSSFTPQSSNELNSNKSPPLQRQSSSNRTRYTSNPSSSRGSEGFADSDYELIGSVHSNQESHSGSSTSGDRSDAGSTSGDSKQSRDERVAKDSMSLCQFPDPLDSHTDDDGDMNVSGGQGELESSILSDYSFLVDRDGSESITALNSTPPTSPINFNNPPPPVFTVKERENDEMESKRETYQAGNIGKWLETTASGSRSIRRRSTIKYRPKTIPNNSVSTQLYIVFIGFISPLAQELISAKIRLLDLDAPFGLKVLKKEEILSKKMEIEFKSIVWICESEQDRNSTLEFITRLGMDSVKTSTDSTLLSSTISPVSSTLLESIGSTASTSTLRPFAAAPSQSTKVKPPVIFVSSAIQQTPSGLLQTQLRSLLPSTHASTESSQELPVESKRVEATRIPESVSRISSVLMLAIATLAILAASLLESTPAFLPPPIASLSTLQPDTTIGSSILPRTTITNHQPAHHTVETEFTKLIPTSVSIRSTYAVAVIENRTTSLSIFAKRHLKSEVGRFENSTQTEEVIALDAMKSVLDREEIQRKEEHKQKREFAEKDLTDEGIKLVNDLLKQLLLVDFKGIKDDVKESWSQVLVQSGSRIKSAQKGAELLSKFMQQSSKKVVEVGESIGQGAQVIISESETRLKDVWIRSVEEVKEKLPIIIQTCPTTEDLQQKLNIMAGSSYVLLEKTRLTLMEEKARLKKFLLERSAEDFKAFQQSEKLQSAIKGRQKVLSFFKTQV